MEYSKEDIEALLVSIYAGSINPLELPEDLYMAIANHLLDGVREGFGMEFGVEFGAKDEALFAALEENTYLFSAAKTFQQVKEMTGIRLVEGGGVIGFDEFKERATEIFLRYNGGEDVDGEIKPGWLEAEYNTALIQGNNAKKWNEIEKQKEILPYLVYNAIDDACDICAPLNGITLPVDDEFWDEYSPENHFNCRCILEQVEKEEGEGSETNEAEISAFEENNKVPEDFKYNAGKRGEIFATTGKAQHPYFDVPESYKKYAANNFDLPIPE